MIIIDTENCNIGFGMISNSQRWENRYKYKKGLQIKNRKPLILLGWETRIRTWINGARTRRPAVRRSPRSVFTDPI